MDVVKYDIILIALCAWFCDPTSSGTGDFDVRDPVAVTRERGTLVSNRVGLSPVEHQTRLRNRSSRQQELGELDYKVSVEWAPHNLHDR